MRALAKRLRRLEERLGPAVESQHTRQLRARLEAGRLRRGLPPTCPDPNPESIGMTMIEILNAGRQRARGGSGARKE